MAWLATALANGVGRSSIGRCCTSISPPWHKAKACSMMFSNSLHVAWKIVIHQPGHHLGGNSSDVLLLQPVEFRDEMIDQQRQIFPPFPQRRELQVDHADSIEESSRNLPSRTSC